MADFGISLVEKLIEAIGSEVINEVCDMWGYKSQLQDLKETVTTIRKLLLDAEAKRELSNEEQDYIKKLKDAVYDADDLFDEFLTLAELKQLGPLSKRGKLKEKVRCFFSSKNQLGQAYRMSRDVKDIKKRLDAIADSHQKFGFSVDYKPISRRREETCSYVDANEIIGRDNDKETVIGMLLDHDDEQLCVVTIVGVGGLGKTALAQLVYNDERIRNEFPHDLRLWVCVSDQDGVSFDVKTILCKILEVVTHQKSDDSSTMELVRHRFEESLRGKKYLLVLDDVWNEDREKWLQLKKFLMAGQGGSRIVVTTRSKMTGTIIGEKHAHELQGLSPENSWLLFEKSAFDNKGDKLYDNSCEFVEMGKKIVAKCYNIPLAIKVVGSLLYGQGIAKWRSLENTGLAEIGNGDNGILPILKLSYHNLAPSLKNCFSYCALFHKDEEINKQKLIDLWMAQGYIIPLDGNQDIEDAAEEHFLILLRRCFFQDVIKDEYDNNIYSFKIHDLIHDVAQEVGREEISVIMSCNKKMNLGETIRHVRYDSDDVSKFPLGSSKMRSLMLSNAKQIENQMCLRVLKMSRVGVTKLPESVGKLLHLRYLDLSGNRYLEVLPDAITRLHNLQTLLLIDCFDLRELPEDFCKLVKLRHLDLKYCYSLTSMPWGMDRLSSLRLLPYYVVGKIKTNNNNKRAVIGDDSGLKALKSLTGIRGGIYIGIGKDYEEGVSSERQGVGGEYLKSIKHLTQVQIVFKGGSNNQEGVLENLEPPSNVKDLKIFYYSGRRIPKWGRVVDNWALSLKSLVNIILVRCVNLEEVPVMSKLPLLKQLSLIELDQLEYMEMEMEMQITTSAGLLFFPSLEILKISGLQKLKRWWKEKSSGHTLTFPRLSTLLMNDCPNLTSLLLCPRLRELDLRKTNEKLQVISEDMDDKKGKSSQLQQLIIDDMGHLKSLPINCLTHLEISGNHKYNGLLQVGYSDVFASSLQNLQVSRMNTLRTLCGPTGLQHFTSLTHLSLGHITDSIDEEENEFEACYFPPNLSFLEFNRLKKMKSLPAGMQYLTSLQTLTIKRCNALEALPEWISCLSSLNELTIEYCPALKSLPQSMPKLTSLQTLRIRICPELEERCKEPHGEDRPKIQHIPHIYIYR